MIPYTFVTCGRFRPYGGACRYCCDCGFEQRDHEDDRRRATEAIGRRAS